MGSSSNKSSILENILIDELKRDVNNQIDISKVVKGPLKLIPASIRSMSFFQNITREINGLMKLTKFFLGIFQTLFIHKKVYLSTNEKFSCIFDLTRQHLPPAINSNGLEDFFFDKNRPVISNESDCVVIISSLFRGIHREKNIIFCNNFTQIIFIHESFRSTIIILIKLVSTLHEQRMWLRKHNLNFSHLSNIVEILLFFLSNISANIEEGIVTNSSFTKSPSIFYIDKINRNYKTCMIHYSENSVPLTASEYQKEPTPSWIKNSVVDTHKVWTSAYVNYLSNINNSIDAKALGSLVFVKPIDEIKLLRVKNQIIFLDREPSDFESDYGVYTENAGINFLKNIEFLHSELCEKLENPPNFLMKPKRRELPEYSQKYLNYKKSMIERKILFQVPWDSNIYNLIYESKILVSMIGISASIIARELNKPSLQVYFGENKLIDSLVKYEIEIIKSREALLSQILEILKA